jgi:hypothetical protein
LVSGRDNFYIDKLAEFLIKFELNKEILKD